MKDKTDETLKQLLDEGMISERVDENGTKWYALTEKGRKKADELVRTKSGAMFVFAILYNELMEVERNPHVRVFKIALYMRDKLKINILRLIKDHPGAIAGINVADDAPEEVLSVFDPVEEVSE